MIRFLHYYHPLVLSPSRDNMPHSEGRDYQTYYNSHNHHYDYCTGICVLLPKSKYLRLLVNAKLQLCERLREVCLEVRVVVELLV